MNFWWWTVVTFLVTVALTIYGLRQTRQQLSRKRLGWDVTFEAPLLAVADVVKDTVQVTVGGHVVHDLHAVTLKVWNAGNTPVLKSDYERPITFAFSESVELLQVARYDEGSSKVEALITPSKSNIKLELGLLNPKEAISLVVILTGYEGVNTIAVDSHIAGATLSRRPQVQSRDTLSGCGVFGFAIPVVAFLFALLLIWSPFLPRNTINTIAVIVAWIGIAYAFIIFIPVARFVIKLVRDSIE